MKATRQNVIRIANRLQADVIIDDCWEELDVEIIAPAWHHWRCDGVHALVGHQNDGEPRSAVWADLLDRMADGIEPCEKTNPQCADWNAQSR